MNVTAKQKEILLSYLKRNPELVTGRINRKCESRLHLVNLKYFATCVSQKLLRNKYNYLTKHFQAKLWDEIAQGINTIIEGPQKSGKEWAKVI